MTVSYSTENYGETMPKVNRQKSEMKSEKSRMISCLASIKVENGVTITPFLIIF